MEMLVDPMPHPLQGMMSWERFLDAIRDVPLETLRTRATAICETEIEEDLEPLRMAVRHELQAADEEKHLPDVLIFIGLKLGVVAAYAYLPTAGNCYQLKRLYWSVFSRRWVALEAIETGCTRLPVGGLIPQSIESDLANRPLFVPAGAVKDLLNLRPPSMAALDRLAKKVIADHLVGTTSKMRKRDFVGRVIALAPGCSRERAERAWTNHAPAAWKRPGRPRQL